MKNEIEKIKISKQEFDELYLIDDEKDMTSEKPDEGNEQIEKKREEQFLSEEEEEIDNLLEAIPEGADIT